MNGFDFVCEAMSITGYNLDRLVSLCDGLESDWLEFKASIMPSAQNNSGSYNEADYIFNLVKALISMSNASGGLVVLGIDDDANAVSLRQSGHDGDKDKFSRHISDKVLLREGWKTIKDGHVRWKESADQLSFNSRWACYQEQDVLVFEVPARDQSLGPITLTKTKSKNYEPNDVVYLRIAGDVGKNVPLDSETAATHWRRRKPNSSCKHFQRLINELQKTDHATYFAAVASYCKNVVKSTEELTRLYVGIEADVRLTEERGRKRGYEADNRYLESEDATRVSINRKPDLEAVVQEVWPAFLVGEPGSGKSTSFRKIARNVCEQHSETAPNWALIVPLSGYTSSGLQELVLKEIPELNWSDILLALESGELMLLLDGLNECPFRYYEECLNKITDLLKESSDAKVFVSTRRSHLPDYTKKMQNIIELRSMSKATQFAFVENHIGHDLNLRTSFWEAVNDKPTAGLIARNPMMLRMAVALWEEVGELPEGMATLYDKFFDLCVIREGYKDLDAMALNIWTEDEVKEHLALLAFSMRCEGLVSCPHSYAVEKLKVALGERAALFLNRFRNGFFVNILEGEKMLRFSHETIQEFLAAVFLTHHADHELLKPGSGTLGNRWYMPIVFAFEMFEQPPEHFVRAAWKMAPLLVCASMRDSERLKLLPEPVGPPSAPQDNLWVRGIIRSLRGESVVEVTERIAFIGRTPSPGRKNQKHPLPVELVATLESLSFWYAMSTFEDGRERLERLQHLLIDKRNLWIELLPHAVSGHPDLVEQLRDSQKIIAGESLGIELSEVLGEASVLELCFMVRNKLISKSDFGAHWKQALNVDNQRPLIQELLALLTTKNIKAGQFNGTQRSLLNESRTNPDLSPRILHTLVRDRVVKAEDIRRDAVIMSRLVNFASPIRVKQLVKDKVLRPSDFTDNQKKKLLARMREPKDVGFILDAGIVKSRQEIPINILNRLHEKKEATDRNADTDIDAGSIKNDDDTNYGNIEDIFKSKEEIVLAKIRQECEDPNNHIPSNGYHGKLVEYIESSSDWPLSERTALIDLAENFFMKHKSKKRYKEHNALIASVRAINED